MDELNNNQEPTQVKEGLSEQVQQQDEKKHLVICVHGLHGSANDFDRMVKKMEARKHLIVYCSKANEGITPTQAGVDVGGKRLAEEVENLTKKLVTEHPKLRYFSIVGHSLGGLFSRYAIGVLYENNYFDTYKLTPKHYISLATPHVGSRRPPRSNWNKLVCFVTRTIFSKTGTQLMLEDDDEPLLLKMTYEDSIFMKALKQFEHKILYANVTNDIQVPFSTASILPKNPYLELIKKNETIEYHDEYKYIIKPKTDKVEIELDISSKGDPKYEVLAKIIKNLNTIEWKRVDVHLPSYFPHDQIIGKYWVANVGEHVDPILTHVSDHFHEKESISN